MKRKVSEREKEEKRGGREINHEIQNVRALKSRHLSLLLFLV
jgi:hypothetical protein